MKAGTHQGGKEVYFYPARPKEERIRVRGGKIYKGGKNSHYFYVDFPPGPDGKRDHRKITVKGSYKDTERYQRDLLTQIDRGQYSVAPKKMTLGEFLDYFLDTIKGRRVNTYRNYEQSANAFRKYLDNTLLAELRADMVQRAVNDMAARWKKSTVALRFQKFKTMMSYAVGIDYLLKNPCIGVIVNKPEVEEKAIWDEKQCRQFDNFLKTCIMRYATLCMLLLKTGARIGEVLALRWSDVDFEEKTIHITRTATEKGYNPPKSKNGIRKVPLDRSTLMMLSRHKIQQGKENLLYGGDYNPENLVFCTSKGKRLPYRRALDSYKRIVKMAELPYITPHGLRHTHATMLLKDGHSVKAVAERLGDDPVTIEKTYAHVLISMREAIVKSIEQMYEEKP
jgi:integrase